MPVIRARRPWRLLLRRIPQVGGGLSGTAPRRSLRHAPAGCDRPQPTGLVVRSPRSPRARSHPAGAGAGDLPSTVRPAFAARPAVHIPTRGWLQAAHAPCTRAGAPRQGRSQHEPSRTGSSAHGRAGSPAQPPPSTTTGASHRADAF
jgi:hypothetical protein